MSGGGSDLPTRRDARDVVWSASFAPPVRSHLPLSPCASQPPGEPPSACRGGSPQSSLSSILPSPHSSPLLTPPLSSLLPSPHSSPLLTPPISSFLPSPHFSPPSFLPSPQSSPLLNPPSLPPSISPSTLTSSGQYHSPLPLWREGLATRLCSPQLLLCVQVCTRSNLPHPHWHPWGGGREGIRGGVGISGGGGVDIIGGGGVDISGGGGGGVDIRGGVGGGVDIRGGVGISGGIGISGGGGICGGGGIRGGGGINGGGISGWRYQWMEVSVKVGEGRGGQGR